MQTSGLRSAVPPNHAATRPDLVSASVEAWQEGNGADSKMNSDFTMADLWGTVAQPVIVASMVATISNRCFPLTLTLSPEEREQPLLVFSNSAADRAASSRGFAKVLETIPPLRSIGWRGEGRGEGERIVENIKLIR